jgi:hypothetical protein
MTAPWIAAFAILALANLATIVVVIGFLRRALPVLEAAARPDQRGQVPLPQPGRRAAPFEGRTPDGETIASADVLAEPAVLLFVDGGCQPCRELLVRLRAAPPRLAGTNLYLVTPDGGDHGELPAGARIRPIRQAGQAISEALGVGAVPAAVAVAPGGTVLAAELAGSVEQLQRLLDVASTTATPAATLEPAAHAS